ncbi:MAG: hypothetical protein PHO92_05890, partial [Candidatus Peribacteraceae bacterium]|nr:hypothetical protein [Candidatus Peribacteraceae bacterium]
MFPSISAGRYHSLYLSVNGNVFAWGNNNRGQLGNGTTVNSSNPVRVKDVSNTGYLSGIKGISGAYDHGVALATDGSVYVWGENHNNQLGIGSTIDFSVIPAKVNGLPAIKAVAAGDKFVIFLAEDGSVYRLGCHVPSYCISPSSPVKINGVSNIKAIAAGISHALALAEDGSLYAWGLNSYGQLGNGTVIESSSPAKVNGLPAIKAIAAGPRHTLALAEGGSLYAWGENGMGQLGNGTTANSSVPVQVNGLPAIKAIAADWGHTLVLAENGNVYV